MTIKEKKDLIKKLITLIKDTEEAGKKYAEETNTPFYETHAFRYGYITRGIRIMCKEIEGV